MNSRTSCAQRQAPAFLAAHASASSREGTSTTQNPPIASGYGPSVTVPSVATTLAFWFSSPPPKTHTPAFRASSTTSCEAFATAGMSSSGMWSIAWASNEIRYRGIYGSLSRRPAPAASLWRLTNTKKLIGLRDPARMPRGLGEVVQLMRADRPVERPRERGTRCRDPAPEEALRGLGLVDDRDQLEIGVAERHDPVR